LAQKRGGKQQGRVDEEKPETVNGGNWEEAKKRRTGVSVYRRIGVKETR
jgi:hypothetical protein